jgi:Matrixin
MSFKALFPAFAACVLITASAHGYFLEGESWTPNRTVRMHLSFTGPGYTLLDNFTSWDESAADALNIWNTYLVHMQFAVDHNSLLPPASNDADNSAFFSDTVYGDSWGSGVLAITLISSRNGIMVETDVIFNQNWTWDSYRGSQRNGVIDFHRVALHEFGHVVGLDHPDQHGQHVVAIMNSIISNLDSLQADDIAGGQSIYGNGPAYLHGGSAPNLINISTRGQINTGDNVMIGGFVIQGSQPVTVILRAIGHSLAAAGITNPISDPTIELHDSTGAVIATNDDWISSPDAQTIASYHLDPPNSIESAIFITLNPGSYTAIVKGYQDSSTPAATGVGLFELYDLRLTSNVRAANISTRGQVLLNDQVMIGGFIIGGAQSKTVVVRALGPSLTSHGVNGALADPTLELHDGQGTLISSNDDWGDGPDASTIQNEGWAPPSPKESALQATLNPGNFTAIVRGVNNTTGIGLVEVYDLSPAP